MAPFLSVITRHLMSRPNTLIVNQASLRMQSDPDYEQIIEIDDIGRGWQFVLDMTRRGAHRAQGSYIFILDDDDILINMDAIQLWKQATQTMPLAVIHKAWIADLGLMPIPAFWKHEPMIGEISNTNYLVSREIFMEYIYLVQNGRYENDFDLIEAIYQNYGNQVVWLDQVMAWSMRRSFGRGEQ